MFKGLKIKTGIALLAILLAATGYSQTESEKKSSATQATGSLYSWHEAYYVYPELNAGLGQPDSRIDLWTPQACLEGFLDACEKAEYQRAAHFLNLNLFDRTSQPKLGSKLAKKLFEVISQRVWIEWDSIPDRPDAANYRPTPGNTGLGRPHRSVSIGSVSVDGREVNLRLQRVKFPDQRPQWVFSRQTVSNIERLYAIHQPAFLQRLMPAWIKIPTVANIILWQWLFLFLFLLLVFSPIVSLSIGLFVSGLMILFLSLIVKHDHSIIN
jgi:hypothetical protein